MLVGERGRGRGEREKERGRRGREERERRGEKEKGERKEGKERGEMRERGEGNKEGRREEREWGREVVNIKHYITHTSAFSAMSHCTRYPVTSLVVAMAMWLLPHPISKARGKNLATSLTRSTI